MLILAMQGSIARRVQTEIRHRENPLDCPRGSDDHRKLGSSSFEPRQFPFKLEAQLCAFLVGEKAGVAFTLMLSETIARKLAEDTRLHELRFSSGAALHGRLSLD